MDINICWPVEPKYPITFNFGEAPAWYTQVLGYPHNGIDIACPDSTAVKAVDKGLVVFADDIPDADGKGVIIGHDWGISCYWHLNSIFAKFNTPCDKGQTIALSGHTGFATGPHLHFAIKIVNDPAPNMRGWSNPLKYLTPEANQPPTPPVAEKWHTVLPGQTLWGISEKYYGNGFHWRQIYIANQNTIKNPNIIYPFMRLRIP